MLIVPHCRSVDSIKPGNQKVTNQQTKLSFHVILYNMYYFGLEEKCGYIAYCIVLISLWQLSKGKDGMLKNNLCSFLPKIELVCKIIIDDKQFIIIIMNAEPHNFLY